MLAHLAMDLVGPQALMTSDNITLCTPNITGLISPIKAKNAK